MAVPLRSFLFAPATYPRKVDKALSLDADAWASKIDDTLFIKYSQAPVTVFAVKDSMLAHNPLGAIYPGHYFSKRLNDLKK